MRSKQKVVLYNPDAVFFTMPLALLAVGSALDPERFDVRIIDGRLDSSAADTVLNECKDALCFGTTVLTGAPIRDALRVTRAVRDAHPGVTTVWGGWHPSLFPDDTIAEFAVDVAVRGQGEQTFVELVERLAAGESLAGLAGTHVSSEATPCANPPRALMPMSSFPPPDFSLIDVERYFSLKQQRQLDYITSAGCPFRCAFCADPFVYGRGWQALEPEAVGEQVEMLWRRYRFTDLNFQDETFFVYRKRVAAIAEQMLERNVQTTWAATMRADQGVRMDESVFELCIRSGMRRVLIGVESGSQRMLDHITKDTKITQVLECAERCARHGVAVIFSFIVGLPGETPDDALETIRLVKKLRAMSPGFDTPIFYYKPYPGTALTMGPVEGYDMPQSLSGWADFDYVDGSSGPWVSEEIQSLVENVKYYNRFAWGQGPWWQSPVRRLARWRLDRDRYELPVERLVLDRFYPQQSLS